MKALNLRCLDGSWPSRVVMTTMIGSDDTGRATMSSVCLEAESSQWRSSPITSTGFAPAASERSVSVATPARKWSAVHQHARRRRLRVHHVAAVADLGSDHAAAEAEGAARVRCRGLITGCRRFGDSIPVRAPAAPTRRPARSCRLRIALTSRADPAASVARKLIEQRAVRRRPMSSRCAAPGSLAYPRAARRVRVSGATRAVSKQPFGNDARRCRGVEPVPDGLRNIEQFGGRHRSARCRDRADQEGERLYTAHDRHRAPDFPHRLRRSGDVPGQHGVVDGGLRDRDHPLEHGARPDLLDHRIGEPDALSLKGDDSVFGAPLVDQRLQPVWKVGQRIVDTEVERRLGEEEPVDLTPSAAAKRPRIRRTSGRSRRRSRPRRR